MTDPKDMTAFQWDILFVLLGGSDYGLGLKRALSDYRGEEVNHGRLYPNLDKLADAGLIEKSEVDKRTNSYELSGQGLDVVEDRLQWIDQQAKQEHVIEHRAGGELTLKKRGAA